MMRKQFCRDKGESKYDALKKDCRMLFRSGVQIECSDAWYGSISDMCYLIEAKNILYSKYGVSVRLDQVKSKFGTLRVYYGINTECALTRITNVFGAAERFLARLMRYKTVTIEPSRTVIEKTRVSKAEFVEAQLNRRDVCVENGMFYVIKKTYLPCKTQLRPTRFAWLAPVNELIKRIDFSIPDTISDKTAGRMKILANALDLEAERIIRKAEDECRKLCEHCGRAIGDEHSPECCMNGWIAYVCEKCAEKTGRDYTVNGETRNSGKVIMTKEQMAEQDERMRKQTDEYNKKYKAEKERAKQLLKQAEREMKEMTVQL